MEAHLNSFTWSRHYSRLLTNGKFQWFIILNCHRYMKSFFVDFVIIPVLTLTHWDLVMLYGDREHSRPWLVAGWPHAISWTNVDLSPVMSHSIILRALSYDKEIWKYRSLFFFLNQIQIAEGPMKNKALMLTCPTGACFKIVPASQTFMGYKLGSISI